MATWECLGCGLKIEYCYSAGKGFCYSCSMLHINFKEKDAVIVIRGMMPKDKNLLGKEGIITKIQPNGMIEVQFTEHLSALYGDKWYFGPGDLVKADPMLSIKRLCAIGKHRLDKMKEQKEEEKRQCKQDQENEKKRGLARKWRSLVGEAQYDLGEEVNKYVKWDRPYDDEKFMSVKEHAFTILIPGFAPVEAVYRFISGSDWIFDSWNVSAGKGKEAYSGKLVDFPIVLEIARVEGLVKKRQIVKIEEVSGDLEEGVVKKPMVVTQSDGEDWSYGPNVGCA